MFYRSGRDLREFELVLLLGVMMSLGALTQDILLPALSLIERGLNVTGSNTVQLVITASLIGIGCGQLFYGPVSDSWGRRKTLFLGLGIYLLGSSLCIAASDFSILLIGRFLQGLGAASPRVLSISIARDLYEGRAMARIVSYILAIQMTPPVFAPALGQYLALNSHWKAIFVLLILVATVVCIWFGLRQRETLRKQHRRDFSLRIIVSGFLEAAQYRVSLLHGIALGISMGCVIGFVMTSPQIFADVFNEVRRYPFYFGSLSLFLGIGSLLSAHLVERVGMRRLCIGLLLALLLLATLALTWIQGSAGEFSLALFMHWAALSFLCSGALFGTINAIAMKPLGHMAGIGAAFVGSLSTFVYVGIGTFVGQVYDGTLVPLIVSFLVSSLVSLTIVATVKG